MSNNFILRSFIEEIVMRFIGRFSAKKHRSTLGKYANHPFSFKYMGEIDALSVKDINLNFNFINIDKTIAKGERNEAFLNTSPKTEKGNRQVPINTMVKPVIDKVLNNYVPTKDEMLFHTTKGTLVPTTSVNAEFRRVIETYGIKDDSVPGDLTLHSLRHTYATRPTPRPLARF